MSKDIVLAWLILSAWIVVYSYDLLTWLLQPFTWNTFNWCTRTHQEELFQNFVPVTCWDLLNPEYNWKYAQKQWVVIGPKSRNAVSWTLNMIPVRCRSFTCYLNSLGTFKLISFLINCKEREGGSTTFFFSTFKMEQDFTCHSDAVQYLKAFVTSHEMCHWEDRSWSIFQSIVPSFVPVWYHITQKVPNLSETN